MPTPSDRRFRPFVALLLLVIASSSALVAQNEPSSSDDSLFVEPEADTAWSIDSIEESSSGPDTSGYSYESDDSDESTGFGSSDAEPLDAATIRSRFDSSAIASRLPSAEAIERLRSDGALRYDVEGHNPESIWDRIGRWLQDLLGEAVVTPDVMRVIEWVFYIIAGIVVAFAIWKIVTSSRSGLLVGDADSAAIAGGIVENIHTVDFDPLIDRAIRDGDYRVAVRLLYLKGLRRLSERGLIDWRRDALNHEYLRQLARTELADPFARCTLLFEYVWYGDFPVDRQTFDGIAGTLRGFIGRVEAKR